MKACVEIVRGAAASKEFKLLPSFEGLQLGKAILEHALQVASDQTEANKHLELLNRADEIVVSLKGKAAYECEHLEQICEAYEKLDEALTHIKDEDTSGKVPW